MRRPIQQSRHLRMRRRAFKSARAVVALATRSSVSNERKGCETLLDRKSWRLTARTSYGITMHRLALMARGTSIGFSKLSGWTRGDPHCYSA